jgi:serine/threonine protein kinase
MYLLLVGDYPFTGRNNAEVFSRILKGKLDKSSNTWTKITPMAKDLLIRLLDINLTKRITAEAALQHPWFKQVTLQKINVDRTIFESLRCHKQTSRM